ncbi:MAG: hypothetical protein ABIP48_06355 [Planctomycetota bacterium]
MNHLLIDCVLLARQNPLGDLAREFQGRQTRVESGYVTTGVLILVCIVVGVWLLSRVVERLEGRRPVDNSPTLFFALCRAHRLRLSQWWLLWRVARHQHLKDPARLFLESERLHPDNVSPMLRLRAAELEWLGAQLFAEAPEEDEKSRSSSAKPAACPSSTPSPSSDASEWLPPGIAECLPETPALEDLSAGQV